MAIKNIVIIDERIQRIANENRVDVDCLKNRKQTLQKILLWQNIYVPLLKDVEYANKYRAPRELEGNIIQYIKKCIKKSKKKSGLDKSVFINDFSFNISVAIATSGLIPFSCSAAWVVNP